MVAVEVKTQTVIAHVLCHPVVCGQFADAVVKASMQLIFCDATDVGVGRKHRDVLQVVQIAEHTHLAELRYSGQECKLDVSIAGFQHPIERFQRIAIRRLQLFVANSL